MTEVEKSALTKELLMSIAEHLSGREDCKGIEYTVSIGMSKRDIRHITMKPRKQVFPNRYKRCKADKLPVINHVIQEHFVELYGGADAKMNPIVYTDNLVKGIYQYQLSVDKKQRRWVRLK